MSLQSWGETLVTLQTDAVAVNTTSSATSLIGTTGTAPAAKYTLPANYFTIGRKLRVIAGGRISTTTGPPNITFGVYFAGAPVFSSGAITTVASVTNKTWELVVDLTCRSIGVSTTATLFGIGRFTSAAVVGATGGAASTVMLPDATPAVGSGFDSSSALVVDLYATWSASSASNSIQLHTYELLAPN